MASIFSWLAGLFGGARKPAESEPPREVAGTHDIDTPAPPDSEPVEPAPADPSPEPPPAPAAVAWTDGWNPSIPQDRRFTQCPNHKSRPAGTSIDRIVVHITGTATFAEARDSFLRANGASAHYAIDRNGDLYQFVAEDQMAYHAGIHSTVAPLYARGDGTWRKYKRYFSWHAGYPADARYLDANLNPVPKAQAALVAQANGEPWPDYAYFDARWGAGSGPVGYAASPLVNSRTIGIETVGYGGKTGAAYTDAMYATLAALVADICQRRNIPKEFGRVCGHEDVNPVERWGWDPHSGFDWSRVV